MILNGTNLLIFLDNVAVGCTDSCTLTASKEVVPATCKDGNGARQVLTGEFVWSVAGSGLWDIDSTLGPDEIFDKLKSGARVGIKVAVTDTSGTELIGTTHYRGYAKCTQWELVGPLNAAATYSFTFEGDGDLTRSTTT